jgi:hypothetical protein
VEDGARERSHAVPAELTGVELDTGLLVVLGCPLALRAKDTIRPASLEDELKTSIVVGEFLVEFLDGELCAFLHFSLQISLSTKEYSIDVTECQGILTFHDLMTKIEKGLPPDKNNRDAQAAGVPKPNPPEPLPPVSTKPPRYGGSKE